MATIDHVIGTIPSENIFERRRRSIVIDYLLATSTHGLRSVGRAYSNSNQIFWIITFTTAFGLMFYFVISCILQYFAYPTQTNIEIYLDRTMPFPAVTICNGDSYRMDKINVSLMNYFNRLYPSNVTFNQSLLNSLALPLVVDLFNRNATEELQSIGFQLSDMLLTCTYNAIDCSNAFTPFLTSALGNCFTFNWKTSKQFFTLSNMSTEFFVKEGLSMTFYVPRELNFPLTYFDIGLTILLHDNDELPLPNENGLNLQPGLSHLLTYRKSTTTFLPSPYSQCTSNVNSDLRALYETTFADYQTSASVAYSESVCQELCNQAYVFSQCSCILPLPFFTRQVLTLDGQLVNANCCNPLTNQTICADQAKQQFFLSDELQTLWCSHCAIQCTRTSFQTDLSAQIGPNVAEKAAWAKVLLNGNNTTTIALPDDFAQRFDYYFDRNYLKVLVSCGSKYVTEYNQQAKFTRVDTFSAVGGQTGLWIGLSMLSVVELSELAYRLLYKRFTVWKNKQNFRVPPTTTTMNNS